MSNDERNAPSPHVHHLRVERTARYYTLGADRAAAKRIWFVLHGYGQLAGEFVRFFADLADEQTLIVAPEALSRFYLSLPKGVPVPDRPVGATWMTREDRASEIADYVEYLDALYGEIVNDTTDRDRMDVNLLGFSQGTATATRWLTHGRVPARRLVLWGGLVPPDVDLSRGQAVLRDAQLTLVLGSADRYVNDAMLAAQTARLDAAQIAHHVVRFDGGHVISRSIFPRMLGGGAP